MSLWESISPRTCFPCIGVDTTWPAAVVRPSVAGGKLMELSASLPPCQGMKACSGALHWAPVRPLGNTVRLMEARDPLSPVGQAQQERRRDTAASWEAVARCRRIWLGYALQSARKAQHELFASVYFIRLQPRRPCVKPFPKHTSFFSKAASKGETKGETRGDQLPLVPGRKTFWRLRPSAVSGRKKPGLA